MSVYLWRVREGCKGAFVGEAGDCDAVKVNLGEVRLGLSWIGLGKHGKRGQTVQHKVILGYHTLGNSHALSLGRQRFSLEITNQQSVSA